MSISELIVYYMIVYPRNVFVSHVFVSHVLALYLNLEYFGAVVARPATHIDLSIVCPIRAEQQFRALCPAYFLREDSVMRTNSPATLFVLVEKNVLVTYPCVAVLEQCR